MRGCQAGQGNSSTVGLSKPSTSATDPADRFQRFMNGHVPFSCKIHVQKSTNTAWVGKKAGFLCIARPVRRESPWGPPLLRHWSAGPPGQPLLGPWVPWVPWENNEKRKKRQCGPGKECPPPRARARFLQGRLLCTYSLCVARPNVAAWVGLVRQPWWRGCMHFEVNEVLVLNTALYRNTVWASSLDALFVATTFQPSSRR